MLTALDPATNLARGSCSRATTPPPRSQSGSPPTHPDLRSTAGRPSSLPRHQLRAASHAVSSPTASTSSPCKRRPRDPRRYTCTETSHDHAPLGSDACDHRARRRPGRSALASGAGSAESLGSRSRSRRNRWLGRSRGYREAAVATSNPLSEARPRRPSAGRRQVLEIPTGHSRVHPSEGRVSNQRPSVAGGGPEPRHLTTRYANTGRAA